MPKITNDDFYPNVVAPAVTDELVCLQDDRVKKMTLAQALGFTEHSIELNDEDTAIYLTGEDLNGILIVDNASSVNVFLPSVGSAELGKYMEIHRIGTGGVYVNAADADVINDSVAGGSVSSTRAGQPWAMIRLRLITPTRWAIVAILGTWTTA
jgi:hypothetical protein